MKKISVMFALVLLTLSFSAHSDPIQDGVYQGKKVGWFKSNATPCNQVCKKAHGGIAEHEKFYQMALQNKLTYVCKAYAKTGNPKGKGQLYGNNFSSPARKKVCMVSTPQGKVQRYQNFLCECVLQ